MILAGSNIKTVTAIGSTTNKKCDCNRLCTALKQTDTQTARPDARTLVYSTTTADSTTADYD